MKFMKTASLILILLGLCVTVGAAAEPSALPRPLELVGLHAYAEKTVTAGQTIHFRTSSSVPYKLSICRLGLKVDDPAGDVVLKTFPESKPVGQPIHSGSYVHVNNGLRADEPLDELTLECWVRPWRLNAWQTLISQHNFPVACGYGLFLDTDGKLQFYLGDGQRYVPERTLTGPQLAHRRWQHVVGTWDGKTKSLWIDGKRVAQQAFEGPVKAGDSPLRLGACGDSGPAVNLLDGDLAMPVIYDRALSADEIQSRFGKQGLEPATGDGVLACWPFDEERGDRVADCSGRERHGRIINSGTWMIGGPSFDGGKVPRYGPYDPAKDAKRGHGLRLASDDLFDCRWQVTREFRIPETAKPGIYVGRFAFEIDGQPRLYHVTFVVKKAKGRPKAKILVLAATNTWLAYNSKPFAVTPVGLHHRWGTAGIANSAGNPPTYSCYLNHRAGQPTYQIGVNTPWPDAGPYVLYSAQSVGYSHLMRADRFLHIWLEQNGYDYDVIGDLDLDSDPKLLDGYQVVAINGHSEYWTAPGYEAVEGYLREGGNVVVLSGNSIFWRVSYNAQGTIMECRKLDASLGGRQGCTVGEIWHSQDGRRGSLMRECGYPAWKLVGLATLGWWGTGGDLFANYRVQQPDHFLFHKPERIGLAKGKVFGGAPDGGLPRPVGHEPDVRLALLRQLTKNVPPGATLPEEPEGIVTLAQGSQPKAAAFDYFGRPVRLVEGTACHMIYWERPQGGRVFHAGSLGAGWGLSADPKFQALLRNVLHHFGVPQ